MKDFCLGLIGAGIGRSQAPDLHETAGRIVGLDVRYELLALEPDDELRFDEMLQRCRARGLRGVNVTHPYKQVAAQLILPCQAIVRELGAVNTIVFTSSASAYSYNTDHTGFMRAFIRRYAGDAPGVVAIAGAGGVGRSVAFALAELGATSLRIFDVTASRAQELARALMGAFREVEIVVGENVEAIALGADGLANCSALGMYQYPGSAFPTHVLNDQRWAFDAVYTPRNTPFLQDAQYANLEILSGYELFFYQGIDAFKLFTGLEVDENCLRDALSNR